MRLTFLFRMDSTSLWALALESEKALVETGGYRVKNIFEKALKDTSGFGVVLVPRLPG